MAARQETESVFVWEGRDRSGRAVQGELRAGGAAGASVLLRRQGVFVTRLRRKKLARGARVAEKEVCAFTRQLATMLKAGVPLLQAFDIAARGHANPALARLVLEVRADVESGTSLQQAFRKHPQQFDALYCNLVGAGEQAGMLDELLARLATHKEKVLALKGKLRSAMVYPLAILAVAFVVTAVIMVWVVPAFKDAFASFGAELPLPTQFVIWLSDQFVRWWLAALLALATAGALSVRAWRRSRRLQLAVDRLLLRLPVLGKVVQMAVVARWTRTLATMFAAGVPLVESLESVGGASGNAVYHEATRRIASAVATGSRLAVAMQGVQLFPPLATQMVAIGEESGALDQMLRKVADIYEEEVDAAVAGLSALLEPAIMVILGGLIGGLVIAMYMPIFKLGSVI